VSSPHATHRAVLAALCRLGLVLLAAIAAPGIAQGASRTLEREFPLGPSQTVRIDLRFGEIHVEPGDSGRVEVELRARCSSHRGNCDERLEGLEIEADSRGRVLEVRVYGLRRFSTHSMHVELWVRVPADRPLDIDLGAGEVRVAGVEADLRVHLGAGYIGVRMPADAVRSVDARAGVGDASLRSRGRRVEERRHLVGGVARWDEGSGQARVDCHVGAGEVEVRLE